MQWTWCGRGGAAARGRWGRARSVWGHRLIFFSMPVHGSRLLRGRGRHLGAAASGMLQHGLWGARAGPVPAIWAGTMALLGAAAGEGVERVVRSQSQGRRRSVDLATVWLHYDGGIAAFDAGSTGRGTGGGWGVDNRAHRDCGGRPPGGSQGRETVLWGVAPPGIFCRWFTWPDPIILLAGYFDPCA